MALILINNKFVDESTGEIMSKRDLIKLQEDNIIKEFELLMENSFILEEKSDLKLIRYKGIKYSCVTIKDRYAFNKLFRGDLKMLYSDVKLSVYAHGFLNLFSAYLNFPINNIVVNSENPKIEKLCEMLGVRKTKMHEILKELEKYHIIKRVKSGRDNVIYFNPFLFTGGAMVIRDTYELFKYTPFNPELFPNEKFELD